MKLRTSMESLFGERDRAVTDVTLLPDGNALLAAVEPPGASNQVPIPGKLKMLRSSNLKVWEEMAVDYRAVAQRATLAAPDAEHLWVATDTGMILTLENPDSRYNCSSGVSNYNPIPDLKQACHPLFYPHLVHNNFPATF